MKKLTVLPRDYTMVPGGGAAQRLPDRAGHVRRQHQDPRQAPGAGHRGRPGTQGCRYVPSFLSLVYHIHCLLQLLDSPACQLRILNLCLIPDLAWDTLCISGAASDDRPKCAGMTKEDTSMTHMQLDGEPWPQIIPAGDRTPLMVSISNRHKTAGTCSCPILSTALSPGTV